MKIFYKTLKFALLAVLFSACTLDVQESFEFKEEFPNTDPFKNQTAWSFIQSQSTPGILDDLGQKTLDLEKFDFLAAAIKFVGYEDLYNQSSANRTYLLLNNNAFMGNRNSDTEIIPLLLGISIGTNTRVNAEEVINSITDPAKINMLKAILKYHLIDEYVDQRTLTIFEKNFLFESMLRVATVDGDGNATGLSETFADVHFRRRPDLQMSINGEDTDVPEEFRFTGTNGGIRKHNIIFNNGVGHSLALFAGIQDYALYANLDVD